MRAATDFPTPFAARIARVFAARKKHPDYMHSRLRLQDIIRELVGEWVQEQERLLGIGGE